MWWKSAPTAAREGNDDGVKLKNCTACFLVKYCSVDCQKIHRKKHKKACRERTAEIKDEELFSQGHERFHICPISLLPIPFPVEDHARMRICCMKKVCAGCYLAVIKGGLIEACPFCRTPLPTRFDELMKKWSRRGWLQEGIRHLDDAY